MKRTSKNALLSSDAAEHEAHVRSIASRYLESEVFHDSEIRVEKVDIAAREVHLRLWNIFALNRASWIQKRREINTSDFATKVIFKGVRLFQIRDAHDGDKKYWINCRFADQNGFARLQVRFTRGVGIGRLQIDFESIEVEDISKRVSKYTPGGSVGSWIESPVRS